MEDKKQDKKLVLFHLVRRIRSMSHLQKLVLMDLASAANAQGICWPSLATIQAETTLSRSSVLRALSSLEKAKVVTREQRVHEGKSTIYHLDLKLIETLAEIPAKKRVPRVATTPGSVTQTPAPCQPDTSPVSPRHRGVSPRHPEVSIEDSIQESKEESMQDSAATISAEMNGSQSLEEFLQLGQSPADGRASTNVPSHAAQPAPVVRRRAAWVEESMQRERQARSA